MAKANNGEPAVRVRELHKSFGTQMVLNGVELEVNQGETVAVLGRSGMGKSVLLKLLIGLQKPDAGTIEIFGNEIGGLSLDELNALRKKVGFLFQNAALYDSLTVEENVAFPLHRHTGMSDTECGERARDLLSRVGMERDAPKLPADISGGMKKRVGLARALALEPEVMLLDEPTAGLDPITAGEIVKLIRELQEERRISSVIVTHDMHSVEALADRVALLHEGNVVAAGSLEEIKRNNNRLVAEFLHPEW